MLVRPAVQCVVCRQGRPKVDHINKRRTKSENVCVSFNNETFGETHGMFVADDETYGADRLWCLLRAIPIDLDDEDDDDAAEGATGGTAVPAAPVASSSAAGAGSSGSKYVGHASVHSRSTVLTHGSWSAQGGY